MVVKQFIYENESIVGKINLLILGATGLIGSACHKLFSSQSEYQIFAPSHQELELLTDKLVESYFCKHRPEIVILAAGMVGGIYHNNKNPFNFIITNLNIQLNVIKTAAKYNVKKLIFFGSSCMYPKNCKQPMEECYLLQGSIEETSRAYAVAKLAGVEMCLAYNRQVAQQRFIPVIPNTVYGPGDDFAVETGHVLPVLMTRMHKAKLTNQKSIMLWGTGAPKREFVHADDVARAVEYILQESNLENSAINIGSNQEFSICDLARMIKQVVGYSGEIIWDSSKPDGAARKLLDSSKLKKLGWQPKIEFFASLKKLYAWYLQQEKKYALSL